MQQPPFSNRRSRRGFSLIEIVVILVIIAMMLVIIVPHFFVIEKERKARWMKNDMVTLNAAIEHYALDHGKASGFEPSFEDLRKYLNPASAVYKSHGQDPFGDTYGPFVVGSRPNVPRSARRSLMGVVDDDFWAPYTYAPPEGEQEAAASSPNEPPPSAMDGAGGQ